MEEKSEIDVDTAYETVYRDVYCPVFFDHLAELMPEVGADASGFELGDHQLAEDVVRLREGKQTPGLPSEVVKGVVGSAMNSELVAAVQRLVPQDRA